VAHKDQFTFYLPKKRETFLSLTLFSHFSLSICKKEGKHLCFTVLMLLLFTFLEIKKERESNMPCSSSLLLLSLL
jgi:hypothetical protein